MQAIVERAQRACVAQETLAWRPSTTYSRVASE